MNLKKAIPLCALLGIAGSIVVGLRSQTLPRLGFVATSQIEMFNHKTGELVTTKALQEIFHSDGTSSRMIYTDSMQETIDPNSRRVTLVDFLSKTYVTQPLGAEAVSRRKSPVIASCEAAVRVASCSDGPVVLGYVTKKVENAWKGGSVNLRRLVSPQLGWFPLVTEAYSNSGMLVQKTTVASVQIGEPSREAAFAIPSGFEEVDAATHMQRGIAARGQPVSKKTLEEVKDRERQKRANILASYGIAGQLKLGWIRLVSALGR